LLTSAAGPEAASMTSVAAIASGKRVIPAPLTAC
jgi:hypothetical protein